MSGQDDAAEKEHDPSQRKLDEARRKGEVPRSADLTTAAAQGGMLLTVLLLGPWMLRRLGEAGAALLGGADRLAPQMAAAGRAPAGMLLAQYGGALAPLILLPAAAALLALLAQRALILAPSKLAPQVSRISPLVAARHKFGPDGLADFAKSALKMLGVGGLLVWQIGRHAETLFLSLHQPPALATAAMLALMVDFLTVVVAFGAAVGLADLMWQRVRHLQRNRMSRQELVDEAKDSEGDPHAKGERRRRGQDIALNRMLRDVARADVVIVNPTHYAVALKWRRGDRHAPICLAKGVDEIAARIRERAALAGVPLHSDPPTARTLHATVAVGEPIRPDQYRAVAAAIRFAEAMRRRKGGRA